MRAAAAVLFRCSPDGTAGAITPRPASTGAPAKAGHGRVEEEARLQAVRDRDGPSMEFGGDLRGEVLAARLLEQREPAREQGRADALDPKVSGKRIAFVTTSLEHD